MTDMVVPVNRLYEEDFYAWVFKNVDLLKQRRFSETDMEHVIEELEDMGKSRERELENRLGVLVAHLLKWQYQPQLRGNSWDCTIKEQRRKIERLLRKNPSLKNRLSDALLESYGDAVLMASRQSDIPLSMFPHDCPYSLEQILADSFLPDWPS
ncbi:MAG: DUF29 domain-containing protein [Nitrospirae bacterium]|nr:DUF29 domain-containing protein [Nitrospirota bacterium]